MNRRDVVALELKQVGRRFGTAQALAGIDLTVHRGEIICLVGRSGCGKSTLLRIIAGVDVPDQGSVLLDGREVAGPGRFIEPEARHIGFVFQDYALFPHLTVEQNVMFGLKRLPAVQALERAAEMIGHVGLQALTKRYPHELSGGEQQRVALARALAPRPAILLMDEPFSNLDRGLRDSVRDETLALLRGLDTTVIMVTHDPEEALSAGDRVVLMQEGRVVQSGSGYDLHDRPNCRYAADFFCAFNRIDGVIRNGRIETAIGSFESNAAIPDGSAALAYIRQSAITLDEDKGEGGHGIRGQISSRIFLGEIEQFGVSVPGVRDDVRIRSMQRTSFATPSVRLTVNPKGVLVFA